MQYGRAGVHGESTLMFSESSIMLFIAAAPYPTPPNSVQGFQCAQSLLATVLFFLTEGITVDMKWY